MDIVGGDIHNRLMSYAGYVLCQSRRIMRINVFLNC